MKLKDYREGILLIDRKSAAQQLDCSVEALRLWEGGLRIPRAKDMKGIFSWSNGAVTPNDFYDLCEESGAGRANGPLPCLSNGQNSEVAA